VPGRSTRSLDLTRMGPAFSAAVAGVLLAIYVASGYAILAIVRRKLPSPWVAFAIGAGGVGGAAVVAVSLLPLVGRTLDSSTAVGAYLAALGIGAALGSSVGVWVIGRRA